MRLAAAMMAVSQSPAYNAATALCKAYRDEEHAVSIVKLGETHFSCLPVYALGLLLGWPKETRKQEVYQLSRIESAAHLGPLRLNTWLIRFAKMVLPHPVTVKRLMASMSRNSIVW